MNFDIEAVDWPKVRESLDQPKPEEPKSLNPFTILELGTVNPGPYWWARPEGIDVDGAAISILQACWELVNLQKLAGKPIVDEGKRKIEHAIRHLYDRSGILKDA